MCCLGDSSGDGVAHRSVNCRFFVSQVRGVISYDSFMKTTTLPLKISMNRSPVRLAFLVTVFVLACLALSPQARAVCQQGCGGDVGNTFLGEDALLNNFGVWNTAVGFKALVDNDTTGTANTAIGFEALFSNTGGVVNTAVGASALSSNTAGGGNTAVGVVALDHNTTGDGNTATGGSALYVNTTGFGNTAMGSFALYINTVGDFNTATGDDALSNNTTGNNNIALGASAGAALTTGDDNIDIGNAGVAGESSKIRIGKQGTQTATYIAGISEAPLVHGAVAAVGITADGQLGVRPSSVRFKELVKPMDNASEAIFSLQPVTFRYKKDPATLPQFGLVAEEVAKVNPDLIARDKEGKPFTVRYDEINAMLLNEFLKEHRKVQELEAKAGRQQKQIEALTAGLQKVSAQLEMSKPAPHTVVTNN
jgi:hypothetical protein